MWRQALTIAAGGVYACWTLYTLISATSPPVCSSSSQCLEAAYGPGEKMDVYLYASNYPVRELELSSRLVPQPKIVNKRGNDQFQHVSTVRTSQDQIFECFNNAPTLMLGNVKSELNTRGWSWGFNKRITCRNTLMWEVPEHWRNNQTQLYFTTFATKHQTPDTLTWIMDSQKISLMYKPDGRLLKDKRYLLSMKNFSNSTSINEDSPLFNGASYMAVPTMIKLGPVSFNEPASRSKFRAIGHIGGYADWRYGTYRTRMVIDTSVSPRDEYVSLIQHNYTKELGHVKNIPKRFGPPKIQIELATFSWRKKALTELITQGLMKTENLIGTSQYETDSLKLLVAGESHYTLLITLIVSVFHMIFEVLALGTSWSFFQDAIKDEDKAKGLSRDSIGLDTVLETLVLIWLWYEGEARIVQIGLLAKIIFNSYKYIKLGGAQMKLVEKTKTRKKDKVTLTAIDCLKNPLNCVRLNTLRTWRNKMPRDHFERVCLISLSGLFIPLIVLASLYQAIFVPQTSWLGWGLKCLALTSYVGGFVVMTPQLYMNFYYRQVESLPWTSLTYNFLNTIIDDLFSFIIRMPNAHRIAVFRDDVVFILYWLQKRHYAKKEKKD